MPLTVIGSASVPPFQNLDPGVLRDIRAHGYERPTPIQAQGVPVCLRGRDILGCAETGSGKTASFAIPMVQHVLAQVRGVRMEAHDCLW